MTAAPIPRAWQAEPTTAAGVTARRRGGFRAWRQRKAEIRAWMARDDELVAQWNSASSALGLWPFGGNQVTGVNSPAGRMAVQLAPGQLVSDYEPYKSALAGQLGVWGIRLIAKGAHWMRVELIDRDPLTVTVPLPASGCRSIEDEFLLGVAETGEDIRLSPLAMGHTIVQGQTRSGKSVWTYGLLAQLASAPDVIIAGSDPTGLLLRPFQGTVHAPWQVIGTDIEPHIQWLEQLVTEMDRRVAAIPRDADKARVGLGYPLIVAVLEEYPGLVEAAGYPRADDKGPKDADQRVRRIKGLLGRLLAEGHKAGIRVVTLAQRADATLWSSGFSRGQYSWRLSFRVDSADSIAMLHPAARDQAERHSVEAPGIGMLTAPERQLSRLRAPLLASPTGDTSDLYAAYVQLIDQRAARLHP